jgi:Dolichyl-phosphate-mannose-protein mannosyltransferase
MEALRRADRATISVVVGAFALAGVHAWWWASHRRGFPLFIDESGYAATAIDDTLALRADGISGLYDALRARSLVAPLVPLATVPGQLVRTESVGPAFLTVIGFSVLLALVTYALARRLASPWFAALAALVVATVPQMIMLSRMYYFAVPSAALFALAVLCFLRSERFTRPSWALAGCVALGLTVLSRTMMLAFVLGPLLAGAAQIALLRRDVTRRLVTLGGAVGAGVIVAAVWYRNKLELVTDYLRGESEFGSRPGAGTAGNRLVAQLEQFVDVVYLPLFLLAIAIVGVWFVGWLSRRGTGRRLSWLTEDAGFLVVVLIEGLVVLLLARDAIGQWLPLVPLAVVLLVGVLARIPWRRWRTGLAAALVTASLGQLVMMSDVWAALGRPRQIVLGSLQWTVTDGRQQIQHQLAQGGYATGRPGRLPGYYRSWPRFHLELAEFFLEYATERGQRPVVFLGSSYNKLFNANDILLASRLTEGGEAVLVGGFGPVGEGSRDAVTQSYAEQLRDPNRGLPNLVVTFDAGPGVTEPEGMPNRPELIAALEQEGFQVVRRLTLPDGLAGEVWWRPQAEARPLDVHAGAPPV